MTNSTTPNGDTLRTQSGVSETPKATYLRKQIDGSPFDMVQTPDGRYFIALGANVLTTHRENPETALAELEANKWDTLVSVIQIVLSAIKIKEVEEQKQEILNQQEEEDED